MSPKVLTDDGKVPSRRLTWLVGLCIVVFLSRLPFLPRFQPIGPKTYDEVDYNRLAVNLVKSGDYGFAPGNLTSLRPPFYSATLSVIYRLFGNENFLAVRLFQIIVHLAIVVLIYLIAIKVYDDEWVAKLAAVLVGIYPSFWVHNYLILTETWFTFWLCLAGYSLVRFLREQSVGFALFGGVCIGISSLTRTVMWPSPPLLILVMLCATSLPWRKRLVGAGIFFLAFALTISPWVVRNTMVQKRFTLIDTNGGLIFQWNVSKSLGLKPKVQKEMTDGTIRDSTDAAKQEGEREERAMHNAVRMALANPFKVLQRSMRNFSLFWGPEQEILGGALQGNYGPMPTWKMVMMGLIANLFYVVTLFTAIISLIVLTPSRRACAAMVFALVMHICAIHTVVYGHSRYHLPGMLLMLIFSAGGITRYKEALKPEKRIRLIVASICCVVLAISWVVSLWGTRDFEKLINLIAH